MKGGPCGREQKVKCHKILRVLFAVYFDIFKTELYHLSFDLFLVQTRFTFGSYSLQLKKKKDRNIRVHKYYILDFHLSCGQKCDSLLKKKKSFNNRRFDKVWHSSTVTPKLCRKNPPKKLQHLLIECLEK